VVALIDMSLEQLPGTELEWRQSERRFHQLIFQEQEIASLQFEKRSGSLATGTQGKNRWTFKRTGFLAPRITVRAEGSEREIAEYTPHWCGGGWVGFDSGRRYQLRHTNFWGTEWAFEAPDGTAAISLSGCSGVFKQSGVIQVAPGVATLPETPVLALLIWYVRLLMNEDAATATMITSCG
jgi:hypothetical protein